MPRFACKSVSLAPAPSAVKDKAGRGSPHGGVGNQAALRRLAQGRLQPKLAVGQVDDPLEKEADRAADQVMRMQDPQLAITATSPQISRKCGACAQEEQELQKKSAIGALASEGEAPASVYDVLRTSGQQLDAATREFFEPRFGHEFSNVRLHDDAQAAHSAVQVGALAYTVGNHVVVDPAHYRHGSAEGKRLLAHELAHTIQQSGKQRSAAAHVARTPRSLSESLDPARLSDGELTSELGELRSWLSQQTTSSEKADSMAQVFARLGAELVQRHPPKPAPTGAPRDPSSVTAVDVTKATASAGMLAMVGGGLAPAPVSPPPIPPPVLQPPPAAAPVPVEPIPPAPAPAPVLEPPPAVAPEPGLPVVPPPVVVGLLAALIILLWPNNSIMSGSEERRLLEEARRSAEREGFDESDADLEANASASEAEDVDLQVESSQKAPGDCTEERHRQLQDDVNSKCKRLPRACSPDMDCRQLKRNWFRNERCARARDKINDECFKGGDPGHKGAASAAWRAAQKCREFYRQKKC